jgi:hypothetical protein
MDVDRLDSTRSDSVERPVDSDLGDGKSPKRVRVPPVTKLIKWNDLPNWYQRKDTPLMTLPAEIRDRIFSLETGLSVSKRVQ